MPTRNKSMAIRKNNGGNHNRQCKIDQFQKFEKLVGFLETIRDQDFTGYVKINFSQGSIGRVEKFEEVLKP
jgi:hypothetical protein